MAFDDLLTGKITPLILSWLANIVVLIFVFFRLIDVIVLSTNTTVFVIWVTPSILVKTFFIWIWFSPVFSIRVFFDWRSSPSGGLLFYACFFSIFILFFETVLVVFLILGFGSYVIGLVWVHLLPDIIGCWVDWPVFLTFRLHFFDSLLEMVLKSPLNPIAAELWIKQEILLRSAAFYPGHCSGE